MSKKGVAVVIGLAAVDQRFRDRLKRSPHEAMSGYELSGEEMQAIAGMDHKPLDKLADSLNHRLKEWFVSWAAR
jgi:hypothetical protein